MRSEAGDDTEDDFKPENNGTDADDDETPRKKSKSNTVANINRKDTDMVKVKTEEAENGAFDNGSYQNPSVEDDPMGIVEYA